MTSTFQLAAGAFVFAFAAAVLFAIGVVEWSHHEEGDAVAMLGVSALACLAAVLCSIAWAVK